MREFNSCFYNRVSVSLFSQVPGDPLGLVRLFASPERFCSRLDEFMLRGALHPSNFMPDVGYWAGNEPDILAPWLFVFAGCPHHTQYWTRWLVEHKYSTAPDGIPGNDDYGTMSAWLVFASLGFYPLSGAPFYIVGSPSLQVRDIGVCACVVALLHFFVRTIHSHCT